MIKNKLIVAGCSVSDRTYVNQCYGDILSNLLNTEYIHKAAGCGSNQRIWRIITSMIMSGEITSNDKLIIQYTEINRQEFWTSNIAKRHKGYSGIVDLVEKYEDFGFTVKYKHSAHEWQDNKQTSKFFEQYQNEFVNTKYNSEVFSVNHYNFCNTLLANNINVVFLCCWSYSDHRIVEELSSGLPVVHISRNNDNGIPPEYLQEDRGHFTEDGHAYVSDMLYPIISR